MIWLHCGDPDNVATTLSLAARILLEDADLDVLITADATTLPLFEGLPKGASTVVVPPDSPTRAKEFLDKWMPSSLVWIGGMLRPSLLRSVERGGINAVLINARINGVLGPGPRWLPRAARTAVQPFHRILTADGATATRLRRGGVSPDKVEATGPITEDPMPPTFDQNEMAVMAEAIGTRPCWFASGITAREVSHMAAAHMAASRKSHRMLLLITPNDLEDGADVAQILREAGLQVGLRSDGDDPLPEHQAYVADLPDEAGLWYRIAPLTFIGGSMSSGATVSPFDPITVGSAVIHATNKGPFRAHFERLSNVQACREVRTAAELGIAIGTLSSPEQSARMALAGWEEITRNAEVVNSIIRGALGHFEEAEGVR